MTPQARSRPKVASALLPIAIAALATGVFVFNALASPEVTLSGGYAIAVLMAGRFCHVRGVLLVTAGCVSLALLSVSLNGEHVIDVSGRIVAIAVTGLLVMQGQSAQARLRHQAGLLELTHDRIFVRGMDDVITYWNRGAEELYGWTREKRRSARSLIS